MNVEPAQDTGAVATVPSPIGGLNAYDNLAAMPDTDAINLNNIVPQPYGCGVRKGFIEHATGLGGPVNSIVPWASRSGVSKLFAFATTKMFDITSVGPVGAPELTGLVSSYWQDIQFANAAGTHALMFSGADNPIWYSDAGIQRLTSGDGIVIGTWKNIDPARLIQATVHQRRVWAVEKDTTNGWYLPPDQVYGVASKFDFGPLFKRGGYLAVLATWTIDDGDGSDDHLVAVSSEGEVAVYRGTDVATAGFWSLAGVYFIGKPVRGRRFFDNVGGDLMLVTTIGVVSMASVLSSTKVNITSDSVYSKKIQFLLLALTNELNEIEGWEIKFFPTLNFIFINIPSVIQSGSGQLVANYINSAWCAFSGMNARCWKSVEGMPYFGVFDGIVYRAWMGDMDKVHYDGTGGTNILSSVVQAYSYFKQPATQKQVGMFRPRFIVGDVPGINVKLDYDFRNKDNAYPNPGVGGQPAALWGTAIWGTDVWSGTARAYTRWYQGNGIGVAVSLRMRLTTQAETTFVATDYSFKAGGIL